MIDPGHGSGHGMDMICVVQKSMSRFGSEALSWSYELQLSSVTYQTMQNEKICKTGLTSAKIGLDGARTSNLVLQGMIVI